MAARRAVPVGTQEPYGHRQQRCDRMAARRAVPVGDAGALRASTAEMRPDGGPQGRARWRRRSPTGIDSRDATGWRPAGPCPLATQEPYGHRQQRCDRMAARRAVPVGDAGALRASTAEMRPDGGPQGRARWRRRSPTGIDSRDATGWRPAGPCPLATQEPYGHRQQRCDRMAARRAVPVGDAGALRASTAEMRGPPQKKP